MMRTGSAKNSDFSSISLTASTFPVKLGNFYPLAIGSPTGIFQLCHQYEKGDFSLPAEEKSALGAKTSGSRPKFKVKQAHKAKTSSLQTKA
jgi:hypothetical protein